MGFTEWEQNVAAGTFSVSGGTFKFAPSDFLATGYAAEMAPAGWTVAENAENYTSYIENPGFENGVYGWDYRYGDDSGARATDNDIYRMAGSKGAFLFNTWSNNFNGGGFSVHQTVTGLPNGKYILSAAVASSEGNQVALRANGTVGTAVTPVQTESTVTSVTFYVTDGTATIGAEGVNNVWFKVDDFKLEYVDDSQPEVSYAENDRTYLMTNPDFEYGWDYETVFFSPQRSTRA